MGPTDLEPCLGMTGYDLGLEFGIKVEIYFTDPFGIKGNILIIFKHFCFLN